MVDRPAVSNIRYKIIGALIRKTRQANDMDIEEFAQAVGIEHLRLAQYEIGELAPSLPELEVIAYFFELPVEHFLEKSTSEPQSPGRAQFDLPRFITLRNRVIGAHIRKARLQEGLSEEELASQMGIELDILQSYEQGQVPIPLPHLEVISGLLKQSLREFYDRQGPVGTWSTQIRTMQEFASMPIDLQQFVSKPVNRPYLELAKRLSEMSVERLRAVAEGLLEITY